MSLVTPSTGSCNLIISTFAAKGAAHVKGKLDRQALHPTCKDHDRVAVFCLDFLWKRSCSGISSVMMREKGTNFWRRWAACGTLG